MKEKITADKLRGMKNEKERRAYLKFPKLIQKIDKLLIKVNPVKLEIEISNLIQTTLKVESKRFFEKIIDDITKEYEQRGFIVSYNQINESVYINW